MRFLTVLILICAARAYTQGPVAHLSAARFWQRADTPYLDVFIAVHDSSLSHRPVPGSEGFYSMVDLQLELLRQADSSVAGTLRRRVQGPELRDTSKRALNSFLTDQFPIALQPGAYILKVAVSDAHQETPSTTLYSMFEVPDSAMPFSDIVFVNEVKGATEATLESRRKHGLELHLRPTDDAFWAAESLQFYFELYNLPKLTGGKPYYIQTQLVNAETGQVQPKYTKKFKPQKPEVLDVFADYFLINELGTGTYRLVVGLHANNGDIFAQTHRTVYIANPNVPTAFTAEERARYDRLYGYSGEQLDTFLAAMRYITSGKQADFMRSIKAEERKQAYFLRFWDAQHNPKNPEGQEWRGYYAGIQYAEQHFTSTLRPGWASDRGRILLTYGPPDDRQTLDDPLLYEVWVYDELRNQGNVYFVFTAIDRASNELTLVHSTLNGEPYSQEVENTLRNMQSGNSGSFGFTPLNLPTTTGGTMLNR